MALSPNQSPAKLRSSGAAGRVCAAREERRKDERTGVRKTEGAPAKALPLRGEGGMTERYEKSPAKRLGFLNGA